MDIIEHHFAESRKFPPPHSREAHIQTREQYEEMWRRSLEDSERFWLEQAETLEWMKKPTVALRYRWDVDKNIIHHEWFSDGQLNVTVNCLDRHLEKRGSLPAIVWQGDQDEEVQVITFNELHADVCRFANVLKDLGVQKGERVCIYMPMVPEAIVATLACARIGAVHSVVFGGFSADSLQHRIQDLGAKIVVTANMGFRGGKKIHLKEIADQAILDCTTVEHVIVLKRTNDACPFMEGRDLWFHTLMDESSALCPPEPMDAEDPLFILYTSGSTGKPKGALHTQAGYLLHASLTHRYIFDIQDDDIYWCTADIGWITGHSYLIYGPLANGTTTLLFEGIPTYPDPGRFWQVVEKHRVTKFYTAPTAIRALISHGEKWPAKYDLSSLKVLGTVGEPINPEAWMWYFEIIGKGKLPIVDTWWQTETGGILIAPLPFCTTLKPGSATKPFFGVQPIVLKNDGSPCAINEGGNLCIKKPWPGMMRTLWGDHALFIDTYFRQFPSSYFTGDGARVDEEGDYWLLGRIDDVVNIAGHRLGTAEVESVLVEHEAVAEAAVVPIPDKVKGQALYAFVTLVDGADASDEIVTALQKMVRQEIGPFVSLAKTQFAKQLPKTRSGKIMRRLLRKIAEGDIDHLGDISTLADPSLIDELVRQASALSSKTTVST